MDREKGDKEMHYSYHTAVQTYILMMAVALLFLVVWGIAIVPGT